MSQVTPSNPPLFEHKPCSRCGGSGSYSFNLMHGSRCYGCNGCGWQLTKRGKAAQAYLNDLRTVPVEQLKVGDLIRCEYGSRWWFAPVTSIVEQESSARMNGVPLGREYVVTATHEKFDAYIAHLSPGYRVRKGWSAEAKREQVELALAYQAMLTKSGVPSKRKGVPA